MADLNKLIKFLQLWQEVEEKSTSASPAVESGSPLDGTIFDNKALRHELAQVKNELILANQRANLYARFIRMSEPYITYKTGSNSEYEITRTCAYGQLREDKKNGLL